MDVAELLAASTKRAVMTNQISMARKRYEELLLVGYGGGVFVADDLFVYAMRSKIAYSAERGIVAIDRSGIPVLIDTTKVDEFMTRLVEANDMAGRSYLIEYNAIVSQNKREMIEGDLVEGDE